MKKVFILLLGLGILRMYSQNVGIGTAVPTEKLHVAGNLRFDGALMPNNLPGTAGQVLVSQGAGVAPVWQTPTWAKICATASTNFVQKWTGTELCNTIIQDNGVTVGINAAPQANDITYVYAPSTHRGAGKSALRAYRTATSGATNGGTSWSAFGVDVALKAYNLWGNAYSAALGVYGYTDYANSAVAVFGDRNSASDTWIGYRDANNRRWGVYSRGNLQISPTAMPWLLWTQDSILNVGGDQFPSHSSDGTTYTLAGMGVTVDYVADFESGASGAWGTAIGVGSIEFIVDGSAKLFTNYGWSPTVDNIYPLGNSGNRWSAIWAGNGVIQTSDASQKEIIGELDYGLQQIIKIKPIKFKWKNKCYPGNVCDDNVYLGFSAQQLQTVIPEVVVTHEVLATSEDPLTFEKKNVEHLGVYYSHLIPVLVKAIQEQQQQIEELQKELERLKNTRK